MLPAEKQIHGIKSCHATIFGHDRGNLTPTPPYMSLQTRSIFLHLFACAILVGPCFSTTITVAPPFNPLSATFRFAHEGGSGLLTAENSKISVGMLSGDGWFVEFAPGDLSPIAISNSSFPGKWNGSLTDVSLSASQFDGQQIWFRVEYFEVPGSICYFTAPGLVFPNNNLGFADNIVVNSSSLTVKDGSSLGRAYDPEDGSIFVGIGPYVIPEPSAVFLSLIGSLGLLIRRR